MIFIISSYTQPLPSLCDDICWNMAVLHYMKSCALCPIQNIVEHIIVSLCSRRKTKLWSSRSHVYIWVSRTIIISLRVSAAYLQQMSGNWFSIIHWTICYSFHFYLFCFLWIEHTQNECSESFITCQCTKLMRDMKAFCWVLCFGTPGPPTTNLCSLNIYLYTFLKSSSSESVRG